MLSDQRPQPDEGFHSQPASETNSHSGDNDNDYGMTEADDSTQASALDNNILDLVLSLPLEKRVALLRDVCASLPISKLFELHGIIGGMVYFDPVRYLPNELIFNIFSHLSPTDLLTASLVSRPWRERTHDEQLWHDCFGREGWVVDKSRMASQEDLAKRKGAQVAERIMRTARPGSNLFRRESRKRPRDEAFSENESTRANKDDMSERDETDLVDSVEGLDSMEGIETAAIQDGKECGSPMTAKDALMGELETSSPDIPRPADIIDPSQSTVKVSPTVFSEAKEPKFSWPYLYKQRRRLERNWETGKYTMFRLPDPNHEDEGHAECVYTIQHIGNWLVSGSRDKTIRIWDLSTYRLKGKPLVGHRQSVLCLQFDPRPDENHDIIISGGSDASVIAWRFSTGDVIKTIKKAHDESVLNLRFDDRYLVTCSKDKTIKLWNRHDILDADKSDVPACELDIHQPAFEKNGKLAAFTLLTTMSGHQAAVNAVQIHGDTIVSASGDRTIKSWNIKQPSTFQKSYTGHTKGIACVQFDGRRIVSGSSDNSVRIFDYDTTAEVACLDGHNNLVRTVQARFGDLDTISDDELLEEARAADKRFLEALDNGMVPQEASRRREPRNAGSSRPEDMLSYGTKVPPGGGGSKWAKIVSGSYDETVIIWKRGKDGKWRPNQRLHQGMLLNHPHTAGRVRPNAVPQPPNLNNINAQPVNQPQYNASQAAQHLLNQAQNQLLQVNTILQQPPLGQSQIQRTAVTAAQNHLNAQMQAIASQQHHHALHNGVASVTTTTTTQQAAATPAPAANAQQQGHGHAQAAAAAPPANPPQAAHHHAHAHPAQPAQGGAAVAVAAAPHHHHHHHHHHHAAAGAANGSRDSNRVFRLQFDARRIIACSQNKVIVGWDFAAGDRDLEWIGDWSVETA